MANQYPPYLAYSHIADFLKYRGLTLDEEPLRPSSAASAASADSAENQRDTILPLLVRFGYYRIDATRADEVVTDGRDLVVILLLAPESKYAHHSGDLRRIISSLDSDKKITGGERDRLYEVIVIAAESVLSKKNLTDVIREFRGGNASQPPFYNLYPYYVFSAVIPEAAAVPRHRIMAASEARTYLQRERMSARDLPLIQSSDPPVVWLGARPGSFVEVDRPSETAGKAIVVRLVTKGAV